MSGRDALSQAAHRSAGSLDNGFMTIRIPRHSSSPAPRRALGGRHTARELLVVGAVVATVSVLAAMTPAPSGQSDAEALSAYVTTHAQTVTVSEHAVVVPVSRDSYSATAGVDTLVAGGTNYDWAKLVMLYGGWPMSDENVTVFTRWMRQENGADDWWNRNNPLNNGWGSGGGGGTGSYDNLVLAAQNAADALHSNAGYSGIVAAFAASSPTDVTEAAIWASPWASGHYANGGHWAYTPVDVVTAPAEAW